MSGHAIITLVLFLGSAACGVGLAFVAPDAPLAGWLVGGCVELGLLGVFSSAVCACDRHAATVAGVGKER